ncbi:MAG: Uncharacterized protein G01um101491_111 [Parcubacteria group bacterium Gr01-1014_91]|nr:MAG: Uncharacterized protein G01um101491_111 [Parcubacteria group bacterium Gr01-1014_91]
MLFGKEKSLENLICTLLQQGAIATTSLIEQIQEQRLGTTKQGVYAALRQLRHEEIVVLHNKKASFNVRWLKQAEQFFATAEQHYVQSDFGRDNFLNLKDGEKISYFFSTPTETDNFWGHALVILGESSIPSGEPAYLYNQHEWFLIARRESERECFDIITKKRRLLVTAGAKTLLDRTVATEFDGDRGQYHMLDTPLFAKNNYYFNIVGDFIIEVWIDPVVATHIESLYQETEKLGDETREKLTKIVTGKGRSRLTISRSAKKAERLKKLLRKNFYIPAKK